MMKQFHKINMGEPPALTLRRTERQGGRSGNQQHKE